MATSESEGQVIGCHTVESWNEQLQKANDNKKLVRFIFSFFLFSIYFEYTLLHNLFDTNAICFNDFLFFFSFFVIFMGDLLICLLRLSIFEIWYSFSFSCICEIYLLYRRLVTNTVTLSPSVFFPSILAVILFVIENE